MSGDRDRLAELEATCKRWEAWADQIATFAMMVIADVMIGILVVHQLVMVAYVLGGHELHLVLDAAGMVLQP